MSDIGNYVNREEAEKPFWISYSDLMTALMILFLVVMVASLTSISQQAISIKNQTDQLKEKLADKTDEAKKVQELVADQSKEEIVPKDQAEMQRLSEIGVVCSDIKTKVEKTITAASVDCGRNVIDLGEAVRFDKGQYVLKADGRDSLHKLVPIVINAAKSDAGEKWLKRVHIQGYTDTDGSYLYNLNLSLKRSEWVMCEILSEDHYGDTVATPLTAEERNLAKSVFLVAGVSFNNQKLDKETSRRVEFKLEFHGLNDSKEASANEFPVFKEGARETCQI